MHQAQNIPGLPATVAIYAIGGRIAAKEPLIEFSDYWKAIWQYFGVGRRCYEPAYSGTDARRYPHYTPALATQCCGFDAIILFLLHWQSGVC